MSAAEKLPVAQLRAARILARPGAAALIGAALAGAALPGAVVIPRVG